MIRRAADLTLLAALLVLATSVTAQVTDSDVVGVYFDPAYSVTDSLNTDLPHLATGYLVLHNPTETGGGLGGWECRIEHEGYQPMTMWQPEGPAVNYATPPDFIVGYTDPLPVVGDQVLLATFDMFIEEPTPFQVELVPLRHAPSIEDAMAYIPWDDKELLTPMTTTTGTPVVASYNWVPFCELDRPSISFGSQPVGQVNSERLMITNVGGGQLLVDPVITGSDAFYLTNTNLPVSLGPGEWMFLWISFLPTTMELHQAEIELGTGCGPVPLVGQGRSGVLSYSIDPPEWHYGSVAVHSINPASFRIVNTGEVPFWFAPTVDCSQFSVSAGTPRDLQPGQAATFTASFHPTVEGLIGCDMLLGPELGEVHLEGVSVPIGGFLVFSTSTLDFGTVYLGESASRSFTVTNTSNTTAWVGARIDDPDSPFQLVDPEPDLWVPITAGYSRTYVLRYEPTVAGRHAGQLEFPGTGMIMPLFGEGADPDSVAVVSPRHIDYGPVVVGGSKGQTVTVTNTTDELINLAPLIIPVSAPFTLGDGGSAGILPPGEVRHIEVLFEPLFSGVETGFLDVGPDLPQVSLEGEGYPYQGSLVAEPDEVVFGLWPVGADVEIEIRVINRGSSAAPMDVYLDPDEPPFFLTAGGSLGVVPPNSSGIVRVSFRPTTAGYWTGQLYLGSGLAPIPVSGTAADDVPLCNLSTAVLEFPLTATGLSSVRTLTVSNTGTGDLELSPATNCEAFYPLDGWGTLAPGETVDISVAFSPEYVGAQACLLELGDAMCEDVVLQGDAFLGSPGSATEDVIGIYFDEDYTRTWINDVQAIEQFTGYLVLKNPGLDADISGWELRMLTAENVFLLIAEYPANTINLSEHPEFTVGMGTPMPATDTMLFATFTFFSLDVPEDTSISLVPKLVPSIPDAMALSAGPAHELRPMYPGTGGPIVAWVNYHDPSVGNDDPVDEPELPTAPRQTRLLPNVPNPFNPETAIRYEVAREGRVRIDVFDVMGRRVATLLDEVRGVGSDQVVWQGRDDRGRALPSGAYYVRLETVGLVDTRKVMLLK